MDDYWDLSVVDIPDLRVHPMHSIDEDDGDLFAAFFNWYGGDFGRGPLPFSGGYAEQPSALIEIFERLASLQRRINKAG